MKQKVYIDSLDTARFFCPQCKKEKIMQLSEYPIRKRVTQVSCRCRCGHSYKVTLEKSMEKIQKTHFIGTFISKGDIRHSGKMIIEKLNSRGLLLRTNIEQNIIPGLKLFLEFMLVDEAKQSVVKKEVVVKARKGKYLSAEFTTDDHSDSLGPYLFFNKLYI